jgi:hypothetical protein
VVGVDLFEEGKEAPSGFTCTDGHRTSIVYEFVVPLSYGIAVRPWQICGAFDLADGAADPAVVVTNSTAGSR